MSRRRAKKTEAKVALRRGSPKSSRRVFFSAGALVLVLLVLGLALMSPRLRQPPEVPEPDTSIMEPQVADKIEEARSAVLRAPDSAAAWGRLGTVLHAHELNVEAARAYRQAAELDPDEFSWLYLRARALEHLQPEQALVEAERAARLMPDYAPVYTLQAELEENSNRPDRAMVLYEKALEADSRSATAEFGLGRLHFSRGNLEGSLQHLNRAVALQPQAGSVRAFLAHVHLRLGNRVAARREADLARELDPQVAFPDPVMDRVTEEAVSMVGYHNRAVRAGQAGDSETAEAIYRRLVVLDPGNPHRRYNLGNWLVRRGKLDEAEAAYRKALELRPGLVAARINLAILLSNQNRLQEAKGHCRKALDIQPEHAGALSTLGNVLALEGKLDEAIALYRRALARESSRSDTRHSLGQVLAHQGKLDEAVTQYREALRGNPNPGPIHRDLALTYARQANYAKAREHARAAQRLGKALPRGLLETLKSRVPR